MAAEVEWPKGYVTRAAFVECRRLMRHVEDLRSGFGAAGVLAANADKTVERTVFLVKVPVRGNSGAVLAMAARRAATRQSWSSASIINGPGISSENSGAFRSPKAPFTGRRQQKCRCQIMYASDRRAW